MKHNFWILSSLFSNACITGLSTLLPLYIIYHNGTVLDVAFALSLFNLALIISAMFWGYFIDTFSLRKKIIVISYLGLTLAVCLLFFVKNLFFVGLIYGFAGFMRAGSQPAIHILIMETNQKKDWGQVFARTELFAVLGMIVAAIFGAFWTIFFGLDSFILVCFCFGVFSLFLAQLLISEPKINFEIEIVSKFPSSLIQRIRSNPIVLPKIPSFKEVDTLLKMLKSQMLQGFPLFLFSIFCFYAASAVYFTSIIPFMKSKLVSDFLIFIVYLILYLTQAFVFSFSSKFVNMYGEKFSTIFSFLPRMFGIILTVFAAIYLSSNDLLLFIIVSFIALDIALSIYVTSTSLILFKLLPFKRRGYYLGIFGATTGAGLFFGSFMSGSLSSYFGFSIAFIVAAIFLAISFLIMRIFNKRNEIGVE